MTNLFEAAEQREQEEAGGQLEVRVDQQIGLLNWNFEELNRQLDLQLAKYDGLTFTDAEMTDAKKVRANLNKVAKVINDRKIEVKKQFCEPYERFADQAKILTGKIQAVSGKIDQQVKEYEAKQKEAKRNRISDYWVLYGIPQIDISQIWEDRWLNQTCKIEQIQKDLEGTKRRIQNDLAAIAQMAPAEKIDWVMTSYLKTLDLGQSLAAWEEYQKQIQKAAEIRAKQEAERAAREAEKEARQAEEKAVEEVPTTHTDAPTAAQNEPQAPKVATWWVYTVKLEGTTEDLKWFGEQIRARKSLSMTVIDRKKEER